MGVTFRQGNASLQEGIRANLYEAVLVQLGTTGTIIPLGDPKHEPTSTTLTTVGAEQVTFTYSKDPSTWDTVPGSKGLVPIKKFDGVDEEADSPDAAYWSRVAGAFSVGAWVNLVDATNSAILAKWDAGTQREWRFRFAGTDKLQLDLSDESVTGNPEIFTTADLVTAQGVWVFVIGTYDGSADATGLNLYENGVLAASTDNDDTAFADLEDLGGTLTLGHFGASPESLFGGSMAGGPLGPFFTQVALSADAILRLYEIGRRGLSL